MKRCVALIVLGVFLLGGGLLACNKVKAMKGPFDDTGAVNTAFVDHITSKVDSKLSLTAVQKAEFKRIVTDLLKQARVERLNKKKMLDKVVVEVRKTAPDMTVMDNIYTKKKAWMDKMYVLASKDFIRFHAMLSPEQRNRLAKAMEDHAMNDEDCRHHW